MNPSISISVILPVYNGGEYLKQSVLSVLDQEYEFFEFLIIDDASTDGSYEWLQTLKDPRISLFYNESNKGLFYNINFLIKKSKSELIKLWAQDDIMYKHCLGSFVEFHRKFPGVGLIYSGRDMIDERGHIKEPKAKDETPQIISPDLHALIAYYTGSIAGNIANACISRKALDRVGLFNDQMKISADFDMWVRLAKQHETGFIKDSLIQLRDHSGQLSRNKNYYLNHVNEDLQVYRQLDSYVNPVVKEAGRKLMRRYKLVFYFTLMAKSFLNGDIKTGRKYWSAISSYENIFHIFLNFIKSKFIGFKEPNLFSAV